MRLSCPNCDAQYEVPDEVMPTSGRDVQCSNCGQTWFQHHPDHMPQDEDAILAETDTPDPDEEVSPPPPPPPPAKPVPERRQLDPAVADILRQEAEAEYAARRKEASAPLESQPDLGLESTDDEPQDYRSAERDDTEDAANRRAMEAKRRMARMRGEPDPATERTANAAAAASRRELLPDIEEINSTLRSDKGRGRARLEMDPDADAPAPKKARRSFRSGFVLALLIFAVLALIYVFAPQIAQNVPQADPYLSSYVAWVDQMRMALDTQIKTLLTWLDSMAAQSSSE